MSQILAWNGGGSSNYSDIINKGAYQATPGEKTVTVKLPSTEDLEKALKTAGRKTRVGASQLAEKIEKLTEEIEDFVEEEIKEFFEELN